MYRFLVMPNPEQTPTNPENMFWLEDDSRLSKWMTECNKRFPTAGAVVFELKSMQKIVKNPEYANYKFNSDGEFVPE